MTLSGHLEELAPGLRQLEGTARARQRRLGTTEDLTFLATTRPDGQFEAQVGGRRLSLEDLGDEARGTLVMAALPTLLAEVRSPKVARLVAAAAREVPPDGDTPAGVARRSLLARVVLILLGEGGGVPSAEMLQLCGALFDLLALPAGAPERRAIEERIWALVARGAARTRRCAPWPKRWGSRGPKRAPIPPLPDLLRREYSPPVSARPSLTSVALLLAVLAPIGVGCGVGRSR